MHHLRPIALCNVLYKIVSKMLALRMKNVLAQIVNPIQSAFLPNCFILDNVIIAYEVLHHMKRYHHGEHGMAALKLDMSKAYDQVEWVFLHQLMMKMGFDWRWISLLMLCVETVRYSVIQRGKKFGSINPECGLRQGDPLSPFLFILCAKGLSASLQLRENQRAIHGCRIARRAGAPIISHLFFADDSYLVFRAEVMEASTIKRCLKDYEDASGQMVNFQKSVIFFSPNTAPSQCEEICSLLRVHHMEHLG